MRMPTSEEWDRLVEIAGRDNEALHWEQMYFWCDDAAVYDPACRTLRGYYSSRNRIVYFASYRSAFVGFRPAIDLLGPAALAPDGSKIAMGTLYMDEQPVKVPQRPTWDGDITEYIFKTKLELQPALADPAYQMMGIKVGSVVIADRVMIRGISWGDIQSAIKG